MPAPQEKASDLLGGGGDGAMNAFMGPISQVGSMAGQLGQGGPFSSLSQLPQQAMQPFLQMLQGGMGGGNPADALAGATTADWLTATPAAGGPVSANLVGAGGGGGGGFGGGGIGALRGLPASAPPQQSTRHPPHPSPRCRASTKHAWLPALKPAAPAWAAAEP